MFCRMGGESDDQDNNGVLAVDETTSPKNKVKLLCSHGGKILPRTSDGQLKYVGGETRVITIPRDVSYSELMKKVGAVEFDGEMQVVLKYQVIPEDLDTLVSVRTNEDLKFMLDEYDRHDQSQLGTAGTPIRLRVFLFPSNPIILDNQLATASYVNEPGHAILLEQRYVDAINGVIRTTTTTSTSTATHAHSKLTSINASRVALTISSACSSPRSNSSPKGQNIDTDHDHHVNDTNMSSTCIFSNGCSYLQNGQEVPMHKVHSSPSLSSLNNVFQSNHDSNFHGLGNHHFYQHHHHHRNYQNHQQYGQHDQQSYHGNHPRPTNIDPRKATIGSHEMLAKTVSSGRVEYTAGTGSSLLTGYGINNYYPSSRYKRDHHHHHHHHHHQGGGGCKMCGHFDECGIFYGCGGLN